MEKTKHNREESYVSPYLRRPLRSLADAVAAREESNARAAQYQLATQASGTPRDFEPHSAARPEA